ncbi:MAG: methylated-DNA--[protein]-cysteine S-methyltransferase [Actinobacteria bacterium]|nr:methylated-DNA--[protein]-cysteine S-methyltransferase [Actinomycetota bacterium]
MRVTRVPYAVAGWGVGELWLGDGDIVVAHDAPAPVVSTRVPLWVDPVSVAPTSVAPTSPRGASKPPSGTLATRSARAAGDFVPDLVRRIHRFFAGEAVSFVDVELDLGWCTPFQRAVVTELRAVPWGEVVSYGELAERAGYPRAGRAAGGVCAANTFFLLVPCHRVVASKGIGSYGDSGVDFKRRLLRLEGHAAL